VAGYGVNVGERRVLIADDDTSIRRLLRRILETEFTVAEADNGDTAFVAARAEPPDVVLLDLDMPVLDGHGALLRFRADPELRSVPVLIVTGRAAGGEDAAVFLRDGAHDFVRKPFEDVELVARVRAACRHRALEQALRERNRELEAFASFAAHDLKSPLNNISIVAELLNSHVALSEDKRSAFLNDIVDMAAQGSRLVADLLALAREDWADQAMNRTRTDLEAVVRSVVHDAYLPEADVRIGGTWAAVPVPEAAARSVFANLLSNAGHYGRDDDGHLTCTITGSVDGDTLAVVFEDGGPGIDPSVARRIFEPFVGAAAGRPPNDSSSGLGLAMVARTLHRHGGAVSLLDGHPRGAAFCITLPVVSA
jgi:signal transduction histidine kinase